MLELTCSMQKYEWGKLGLNSKVASLFKNVNREFVVDKDTPYAELWMGTHVNGPSRIKQSGEALSGVIQKNPEWLGAKVIEKFGCELPFLFKVLSINKPLSIQVHPAKEHAEQLHSNRPDLYKDPNHKPELAVALTPFEALCGFRPPSEIKYFVKAIPELRAIVGEDLAESFAHCTEADEEMYLRKTFKALVTCPGEKVASELEKAMRRFSNLPGEERVEQSSELVERLYGQFPNDVGCFAVYFLNFVKLRPNEAIYLGANEPHAYLSGDCVECMACSDNVVRAGLTPKYKDVETLCSMLNYEGQPADKKIFKPVRENDVSEIFKPPVPDFAVAKLEIRGLDEYNFIVRDSASILLVVRGDAKSGDVHLKSGCAMFIPANVAVTICNITSDFLAFQAMANV